MSKYEQVIDEIVKHGVVVKVNKIVDDNYIPYERKYVGCVVELDFSEHDKKVLEENTFKIKMHKDPLDMSFEIDGKTHSAYSLVNGIEYRENIIKAQSKEKDFLEARIAELEKICDNSYDENKELKQRIAELENENKNLNIRIFQNEAYGDKKLQKINLNDRIKVKLTPLGAEIHYHQYDELNKKIKENGGTQLEPRMPEIDKDGFTEFTLWHFMELYGEHIGMCKPNVIEPLNIVVVE